ncbi:hypothetical protein [Paenibacillus sp. XY044]|uniref:hypothetical protein n=1 Tax=Paenibacillus sp. XY044 TaxID=2026089 RepID=UPI000B98FEDE|nr:hypothetical protein [Paenibacillus sp. XY044]OZB98050.1 hypothetical protein CJP46_02470 [Paenibacillus sp. XY044]
MKVSQSKVLHKEGSVRTRVVYQNKKGYYCTVEAKRIYLIKEDGIVNEGISKGIQYEFKENSL